MSTGEVAALLIGMMGGAALAILVAVLREAAPRVHVSVTTDRLRKFEAERDRWDARMTAADQARQHTVEQLDDVRQAWDGPQEPLLPFPLPRKSTLERPKDEPWDEEYP